VSDDQEPVVLDLAPLPREQLGPFLLLGVDKDAGKDQIEANWARRLIWARKRQFRMALEDVNWAREILNQPEQHVKADVSSLNPDTIDGTLRRLARQYGAEDGAAPSWQPLDVEKTLDDVIRPEDIPDPAEIRAAIVMPELPLGLPAAGRILDSFVDAPLDPWALHLATDSNPDALA
jgi:hypothetical protein